MIGLAVRRSPAVDRDDNRREWDAELAVLTTAGRGREALRYAAGLAVARQPGGLTAQRIARAGRLVVVAPVLALVLVFMGLVLTRSMAMAIGRIMGHDVQSALLALFAVGLAVGVGLLGRHWTVRTGAGPRILAVTVPGFALGVLLNAWAGSSTDAIRVHAPAFAIFFAGLAAGLVAAVRLAGRGRVRLAWLVGLTCTLLAADVATVGMMALDGATWGSRYDSPLDYAYAPLWLLASLSGLGVGGMPSADAFLVWDVTGLDSYLYVVFTGLAFGAVLGGRRNPVTPPAPDSAALARPIVVPGSASGIRAATAFDPDVDPPPKSG
ncbi:hypothetical protein [Cryptosporangium phraense]|uniref:Uncharacterized protein n=1 Tax=Cryptosporangium phraense TaxID=2593070 RepID=A0A545AR07_9ACTN|nr:hypothetical protein [Cryptosporangium phraense]TQS43671.1 hypothetical protein FL583_18755 [Cryptosporangium phraense]